MSDPLEEALDALLSAPDGEIARDEEVERVLTEGYARALELEAKRLRIAAELEATPPAAARGLRAIMAAVTMRLGALRGQLDEANRRYRGSRKQDLDGRSGSRG